MVTRRRDAGNAPSAWVAGSVKPALEVDFDLDLNAGDDPNAGFAYVERDVADTEAAVFNGLPCDVGHGPKPTE